MCPADRSLTPWEAAGKIQSGQRIVFSHACGEPRVLPQALVTRASELRGVEIIHMVPMGPARYCQPKYAASFRHITFFAGATTREAVSEGRADYLPCFFSQVPRLLATRLIPDVAWITVSPPDRQGNVSLGVSVDYTLQAVKTAKSVIAEVNPTMPRTFGRSSIPFSTLDGWVEVAEPIYELSPAPVTDLEQRIGRFVAELIEDGCCLQLGIGGIPEAVLSHLTGFKDLGIHSEMISDGVMRLVEQGVITNRKKTLHPGKIVATFLMGSRDFYRWVHENPLVEMHPVEYTNDPGVIARNRKMVSINSALEVDLLGQVSADTLGPLQYSGVGGQVDFVRGAAASEGGKSIIALPSRAKETSRIVCTLNPGASVTTSRNDVDTIVTEHGIAVLKGKTVRERMQALIQIADPGFREALSRQAFEQYRIRI